MNAKWALLFLLPFAAACATGKQKAAQRALADSADINIQVATSDIQAARRAGAAAYAPQDLSRAESALRDAGQRYRTKDYEGSRRSALAATAAAKDAKSRSEEAKRAEEERARAKPAEKMSKPKKR